MKLFELVGSEQFRLAAILAEHEKALATGNHEFQWKPAALENILDLQLQLIGRYMTADIARHIAGIGRAHNMVLVNTLSNSIYAGLSAVTLLRRGFYGSSRVVARQLFEMLLVAKLTIVSPNVQEKWKSRGEKAGKSGQVSISSEILNKFWPRTAGTPASPLHQMWATLNDFTHHTRYAQQPLLVPDGSTDEAAATEGKIKRNHPGSAEFLANVHYSLDLTATLACMTAHLLTPHYRKTVEYVMRSYGSDMAHEEAEEGLRARLRQAERDYWRQSTHSMALWKPALKQYRSRWTLPP